MIKPSGKFQNLSSIQLHTFEAIQLCNGSRFSSPNGKRYIIPDIVSFGYLLNTIWNGAKYDDPYAESLLIEIERLIDRASLQLDKVDKRLNRLFSRRKLPKGIIIELNASEEIRTLPLDKKCFMTTHIKLFIILLASYDNLIRKIKTYREFTIINRRQEDSFTKRATKVLRAILMAAKNYKKNDIRRSDIVNKTPAGLVIIEKNGMLPLEVINREVYSQYGPSPILVDN